MNPRNVKKLAGVAAIMTFFATVIAGIAVENPVFTCALRAIIAAGVMYTIALIAGRVVLRIIVEEMVSSRIRRRRSPDSD